jgi:ABC-type multidrug transport system ATPase subunit
MQQDCLIPTLTVRETLQYSADLRLREVVGKEERRRIVEEVILELGLKECANTRIGNETAKGCSGGEKRRTSIGVQLLANPAVIFADEPSTGLDATSAKNVIKTLKDLARKGRTVIVTIHQPRSEIWDLFDRVILLTQGSCAFSGPTSACVPYFASRGYELPPFVNPAEFIIDLVAVDNRSEELELTSADRVDKIKRAWMDHCATSDTRSKSEASAPELDAHEHVEHPKVSVWRQIRVLTARTSLVTLRDPMGILGTFVEAILMSIITGWIFYKLDGSLQGIRSKQSAFYVGAALQGYLILMYETYRVTIDIEIFDRERTEGVVGVAAFLISRRLAKVVEDIGVCYPNAFWPAELPAY